VSVHLLEFTRLLSISSVPQMKAVDIEFEQDHALSAAFEFSMENSMQRRNIRNLFRSARAILAEIRTLAEQLLLTIAALYSLYRVLLFLTR
jgi:hypothetical protein